MQYIIVKEYQHMYAHFLFLTSRWEAKTFIKYYITRDIKNTSLIIHPLRQHFVLSSNQLRILIVLIHFQRSQSGLFCCTFSQVHVYISFCIHALSGAIVIFAASSEQDCPTWFALFQCFTFR